MKAVEVLSAQDVNLILSALNEASAVDFRDYARASLRDRIVRVAGLHRIQTVEEMVRRLREGKDFPQKMIHEISFNTTEMYRDPGFWKYIRDRVLPDLAGRDRIRIWHAACGTGEEVYSLNILLESAGLLGRSECLATDLNVQALALARKGRFPVRSQKVHELNWNAMGMGSELSAHHRIENHAMVFDTDLVRNVSFERHDLGKDRVPGAFDLLLCRNAMIYFNPALQEKVIRKFVEGLNPGGYLGIGYKESLPASVRGRRLDPVDPEEKIYKIALS
ncbi:MAG: CheR family methyltransferase [Bacteroidales bacterium]